MDIQQDKDKNKIKFFSDDVIIIYKKKEEYGWSLPGPVAARSKAYVFGRSPAEIVGSNSTRGMDVCLLCVLCVVR